VLKCDYVISAFGSQIGGVAAACAPLSFKRDGTANIDYATGQSVDVRAPLSLSVSLVECLTRSGALPVLRR
jgi:hypothetical protein